MRLFFLATMTLLFSPVSTFAIDQCNGIKNRKANKVTCVVDGDTRWERGVKWRLVGVDTPEPVAANASCANEIAVGKEVSKLVTQLLSRGYEIHDVGKEDSLGRRLVAIKVNNVGDLSKYLIKKGFAQPWPNTDNPWC